MNADLQYNNLVKDILQNGVRCENRTGIDTLSVWCREMRFDLAEGFPILTTRRLPTKATWVELEGFINGINDKTWYESRGCKYWSYWCNPEKIPYDNDDETKKLMFEEKDLGDIYGVMWNKRLHNGERQLEEVINKIKNHDDDRRLIVNAWQVDHLHKMALVPCHYSMTFNILDGKLNLKWNQRSVDVACGLPQNIVSYATLLHLVAKIAELKPGELVASLENVHVYANHAKTLEKQVHRVSHSAPKLRIKDFGTNIYNWTHKDCKLIDYKYGTDLKYPVAI